MKPPGKIAGVPAALRLSSLAALLLCGTLPAQPLDPAYHSPDEIASELHAWEDDYPEWVSVDSIGHSAHFQLPIYLAKLSDNPDRVENEPALLFVGQVHAEEVLGVEITLSLIRSLLENLEDDAWRRRLEGLELYFIPTLNPEGLDVVTSGQDVTYRKNCRDNVGDGHFRYREGVGWDTSGVDLNRNFALHWDRGDTLLQQRDEPYIYNYYRGAGPFSEPETRTLRDLALQRRFQYSLVYHSSRSGRNAERVIAPWSWDGRYPPDINAIDALGSALATRIPDADGVGNYAFTHATQRNGQAQDWFYQQTGTFQYMVEVGAEVQPDSAGMAQVVADNIAAVLHLMDLALDADRLPGYGTLTINAATAQGEPLDALIRVEGSGDPVLEPRRACAANGRLDLLLPEGEYPVRVDAFGYTEPAVDTVVVTDGERAVLEMELQPLDFASHTFHAVDAVTGEPLAANLRLTDRFGTPHETQLASDGGVLELPPGAYRLQLTADGYLPLLLEVVLDTDTEHYLRLVHAETVYSEDFDADAGWQRGGRNEEWGVAATEGITYLTDSPVGAYQPVAAAWIVFQTVVELKDDRPAMLEMIHRPYYEPGRDSGMVDIYQPQSESWSQVYSVSRFPNNWETTYISLADNEPGELWVRLRYNTDDRVEEDGWRIDRLTVYEADIIKPAPLEPVLPGDITLSAYPNPSNSRTLVTLTLPQQLSGELALYDARGRLVRVLRNGSFEPGAHRFTLGWDNTPSGTYILRFGNSPAVQATRFTILK